MQDILTNTKPGWRSVCQERCHDSGIWYDRLNHHGVVVTNWQLVCTVEINEILLCVSIFVSDYWEGEERPSGGDRDSVEIRTASKYYYLEGCECDTPQPWWNEEHHFFFIFITVFNKPRVVCLVFFTIRCLTTARVCTWFRTYWEETSCWTELWRCQISQRGMLQTSSALSPRLWNIYTHRG